MWKRVKETKPPIGRLVLVSDGEFVGVSAWMGEKWEGTCPLIPNHDIIAWKPLDPPPIVWWSMDERQPKPGTEILAELKGCKLCGFSKIKIREGDSLSHIASWTYTKHYFNSLN